MYVLIALLLLQSPSFIKLKNSAIKQSTPSHGAHSFPQTSQSNFPTSQLHDAEMSSPPSTHQEETAKQESSDRVYKVDVVSPPAKPLDTPLFPWYLVFTGVGVLVNVWVAFLIYRQTKINWHQVRANIIAAKAATRSAHAAQQSLSSLGQQLAEMEKAADAAKKSADALAGSERAWLLVNLQPPADGMMVTCFTDAEGESVGVMCLMICQNSGKTPALDVRPMATLEIVQATPNDFSFNEEHLQRSIPFPAIGPGESGKRAIWLKANGVLRPGDRLVIHGVVKYFDIFERERTTTFCHHVFGKADVHPIEAGGCHRLT